MFIVAVTSLLGLDHQRDTLFNAVCHQADIEFADQYTRIDCPFSSLRPFAPVERPITPTQSVENDWADAATERVLTKLEQAKQAGRFAIVNEFGHGIMQRAAFYREQGDVRAAEHLHHGKKVPEIVKPLGLGVPYYLRLWGSPGQMREAMLGCPGRNARALAGAIAGYMGAQIAESDRYFAPKFGQRRTDVDLGLRQDEQVALAVAHIRTLLNSHEQAMA